MIEFLVGMAVVVGAFAAFYLVGRLTPWVRDLTCGDTSAQVLFGFFTLAILSCSVFICYCLGRIVLGSTG